MNEDLDIIIGLNDIEKNIKGFEYDIDLYTIRIKENQASIFNYGETIQKKEEDLEELRNELRVITDDIVTQMDQKLRNTGYSSRERKKREELLEGIIDFFRIQIQGKCSLLEDAQRVGEFKNDLITSLITTFNQINTKITVEESISVVSEGISVGYGVQDDLLWLSFDERPSLFNDVVINGAVLNYSIILKMGL